MKYSRILATSAFLLAASVASAAESDAEQAVDFESTKLRITLVCKSLDGHLENLKLYLAHREASHSIENWYENISRIEQAKQQCRFNLEHLNLHHQMLRP